MPYSLDGFYPDQRGAGFRVHNYSNDDNQSVVEASGYFDTLSTVLQVEDIIRCIDNTADKVIFFELVVDAITSGVVTTRRRSYIGVGIVSGKTVTHTLTEQDNGKTVFFDSAAGIIYTLPLAQVGLKFKFITTVDLTSNTYAFVTGAATEFIVGAVNGAIEAAATGEVHFANGTTHIGLSSNKTTTGGLIGGEFEIECLSATLWSIKGTLSCTATPATPFTT